MDRPSESDAVSHPDRLQAPWSLPDLAHGFFSRRGGVSRGPFSTLNLSHWVGDDPAAVDENWRIARESMPPGCTVAKLNQVHGSTVITVGASLGGGRPNADGLVTSAPGTLLAILSADCVPILMVDAERGVAAALHAGWRGTLAAIAAAGVHAMVAQGAVPGRIRAALGPSIGPCCFEVDEELAARFEANLRGAGRHSRAGRPGKAFIDLRGVLRGELERCGVESGSITSVGPCTRCANERYFSRRAAGGASTGLQLSYIGLVEGGKP